jgi:hypothetical protein
MNCFLILKSYFVSKAKSFAPQYKNHNKNSGDKTQTTWHAFHKICQKFFPIAGYTFLTYYKVISNS